MARALELPSSLLKPGGHRSIQALRDDDVRRQPARGDRPRAVQSHQDHRHLRVRAEKSNDLRRPLKEVEKPIVFHLLGRMSPTRRLCRDRGGCAGVHPLAPQVAAAALFEELHSKHLLVIGCRFPAWLVRSFIRLSRRTRLLQATGGTVFVVDSGAREDRRSSSSCGRSRRGRKYSSRRPVEFVDELYERYGSGGSAGSGGGAERLALPRRVRSSSAMPAKIAAPRAVAVRRLCRRRSSRRGSIATRSWAAIDSWIDPERHPPRAICFCHPLRGASGATSVISAPNGPPHSQGHRDSPARAVHLPRRHRRPAADPRRYPEAIADLSVVLDRRRLHGDILGAVKARYKKNQGD